MPIYAKNSKFMQKTAKNACNIVFFIVDMCDVTDLVSFEFER